MTLKQLEPITWELVFCLICLMNGIDAIRKGESPLNFAMVGFVLLAVITYRKWKRLNLGSLK